MLSDPWNLPGLESHCWIGVASRQRGTVAFIKTPLKYALSGWTCLGPEFLVPPQQWWHPVLWAGGSSVLEDEGKVTKCPGRLLLGCPGEASFLRAAS